MPSVIYPLILVFQILNYSTGLFQRAGLQLEQAKFATMGIGAIMVGMTLVSIMLMDRAGRRSLHLYGLGGMFVFSLFITIAMLLKVKRVLRVKSILKLRTEELQRTDSNLMKLI
jgi:hypothetical protein